MRSLWHHMLLICLCAQTAHAEEAIEWKLLHISAAEGWTMLHVPEGKRLYGYAIGRWDPASEGTLGVNESSLGAAGVSHLKWLSSYPGGTGIGWTLYEPESEVPPREFLAPEQNYFALIFRIIGDKKWKAASAAEGYGFVNTKGGGTIEFRMNDQEGHFFNNRGNLHLMYTFLDEPYLTTAQRKEAQKLRNEQIRKINLIQTEHGQSYRYGCSIPGLHYDWVIKEYNGYLNTKFEYGLHYWNTSQRPIRATLTLTDNMGDTIETPVALEPGEMKYTWFLMEGMTIDPSKTRCSENWALKDKGKQ